jgi:hypothetical protein
LPQQEGGRLDLPPHPSALVALPESFGRRFLVFVDTEEEFDWSQPYRRDTISTTAIAALPQAHRRFRDHGVAPTYLVDYPVANSESCIATLRPLADAGECAIGAQLHPWVNPPFDERLSSANSFPGNLPRKVEAPKLGLLTERISAAFGVRPTVYRAGRYGVGPNSAALVEEAGYRLDASVRPLFEYRAEGGPDFLRHPIRPWWAGPRAALLEIPSTSAFVGWGRSGGHRLHALGGRIPYGRAVLARGGMLSRVPLTPEGIPVKAALDAIRRLLDDGTRVFSLSFHSPSLAPGHTPYVRDAADLARFWAWWEAVLALFAGHGIAPARPDELIEAAWSARGAEPLASTAPAPLSHATARGL